MCCVLSCVAGGRYGLYSPHLTHVRIYLSYLFIVCVCAFMCVHVCVCVFNQQEEDLAFLMAHDTDSFNRWEASQKLANKVGGLDSDRHTHTHSNTHTNTHNPW